MFAMRPYSATRREPEHVTIESDGAIDVVNVDADPDLGHVDDCTEPRDAAVAPS